MVIDGLYSWDELKILQEEFGENFKVIAILTDKKLRYESEIFYKLSDLHRHFRNRYNN